MDSLKNGVPCLYYIVLIQSVLVFKDQSSFYKAFRVIISKKRLVGKLEHEISTDAQVYMSELEMQTGAEGLCFNSQSQCDSPSSASLCIPAVLPILTGVIWTSALPSRRYTVPKWLSAPYSRKCKNPAWQKLPSLQHLYSAYYQARVFVGPVCVSLVLLSHSRPWIHHSPQVRSLWKGKATGTDRDSDCSLLRPTSPGYPFSPLGENSEPNFLP